MYIENVQCYENRKVFRYYHDYENTSNKLTVFEYHIYSIRVITKLPNSEQSYKGKVKLISI